MNAHSDEIFSSLSSHIEAGHQMTSFAKQQQLTVQDCFALSLADQANTGHKAIACEEIRVCGGHDEQNPSTNGSSAVLEFSDISYWLPAQPLSMKERLTGIGQLRSADSRRLQEVKGNKRRGKQLLLCVSGCAHAGRLLAIMGPSGAGKTTLLSILAGERDVLSPSSGSLSGKVLLAGQERQLQAFKKICAYVKQDDMLLPTTTPREALVFTAALRLPGTSPSAKQARAAAVEEMLEGMCLLHCADTLVGESRDGVKGLSGGERRRLAVAADLLGRPSLALLDEPSSGQDSSTAVQVLSFIKQLITSSACESSSNQLVAGSQTISRSSPGVLVITLHQPGREITALLDDLLLLAPGGKAVYAGPWPDALPYFQRHLQLTPPEHTGLAEWYLSLLTSQGLNDSTNIMRNRSKRGSSCLPTCGGVTAADSVVSGSELEGSSSSSVCAPTLHEAWIAYTSRQQPLEKIDVHETCGSCSSWGSKQKQQKQEPPRLPVIRVVVGRDTTSSSCSAEHEPTDQSTLQTEIQLAAAAHITAAGCTHDVKGAADTQFDHVALDKVKVCRQCSERAGASSLEGIRRESASWWVQVYVLSLRNLRYWWRSPGMVLSEAAQYMFVVLFLGSIYPRLSLEGTAAAVDRLAALFMWLVTLLVTAPSRALLSWDMERQLLRHELASGAYGLTPFLISKLAVGLPLETLMVSVAGSLLYLLLGLQPTGSKYGSFLALNLLCALSAHNFGNLLGLCLPSLHAALPALCVGATLLLSFAGFIVQAVPVWWVWMGDVSFCTYAYAGMVRNEFEGLQLKLPAGAALSTGGTAGSGFTAATQNALQAALEVALPGLGISAANLTALIDAQVHQGLVVDGLHVVPATVRVQFGTVQQFIALLLAFTVGSSVLVVACTASLVRFRYR